MKNLLILQFSLMVIATVIAGIFFKNSDALAVFLGGLSYFFPTVLAIVILQIIRTNYIEILPLTLIVVEVNKIMLVVVMMVAIYLLMPNISWLSYLIGLFIVTQVGLLMFRKSFYYE